MASVYKRGEVYYARVTHKGVEYRQSLETTSRSVAHERLETWVGRLKSSNWKQARRTFDEAVDKFTAEHHPRLKPAARRRYVHSLLNLADHFSGLHLDEIDSARLSAFEAARRKAGRANGSIRRDIACLSSLFRLAKTWRYHSGDNPALTYLREATAMGLKEAPPRTRYLSHEEEAALLTGALARIGACGASSPRAVRARALRAEGLSFKRIALALECSPATALLWCRGEDGKDGRFDHGWRMFHAASSFAIDTGLREEEQLSLTWDRISLDGREVVVPDDIAKSRVGRRVPLLPRTVELLRLIPRHPRTNVVFWYDDGLRYNEMLQKLNRLSERLGIPDLRWHDLRRTCGCRLLQDLGLSMEQVSLWLGHSSVKVTEQRYAFLDVRHLHAALKVGAQKSAQAHLRALPKSQETIINTPLIGYNSEEE